jgi:hypothetical protein
MIARALLKLSLQRYGQAFIVGATLGVEAGVNFRLRIVGSDSHGWGGPMGSVGAPVHEQHLEYRLLLPLFDANRSAYRWSLTVHRHGDGSANQYTGVHRRRSAGRRRVESTHPGNRSQRTSGGAGHTQTPEQA